MNIPGPRRRKRGQPHGDGLARILAPSVLAICVCTLCLCGTTWAWFTATASSGTAVLQSSSYKLAYQTDTADVAAATDFTETAVVTVPEDGQCSITLSATGTAGAAGYCSVQVGDETYYTEPIFVGGDSFSFTVTGDPGAEIQLTPKWGSYSGTATLHRDDVISTTGNTQQENTGTTDMTTEQAEPTEPTATTAPSRSPEESAASTPDTPADSATAQPEGVTGGEQAPAPEDSNR